MERRRTARPAAGLGFGMASSVVVLAERWNKSCWAVDFAQTMTAAVAATADSWRFYNGGTSSESC